MELEFQLCSILSATSNSEGDSEYDGTILDENINRCISILDHSEKNNLAQTVPLIYETFSQNSNIWKVSIRTDLETPDLSFFNQWNWVKFSIIEYASFISDQKCSQYWW